jgi:hypothetical protein
MALDLGARLPFSSRVEVFRALFAAAADAGGDGVSRLLTALRHEVLLWQAEYDMWPARCEAMAGQSRRWSARVNSTVTLLASLVKDVDSPR